MEGLLCEIGRFVLAGETEDEVRRMMTKSGLFFVKSMFMAHHPSPNEPFPWQTVWRSCVQPKISFFTWKAVWGKFFYS